MFKSIAAGMLIGIGAIVNLQVGGYLGSFLFSVALMTIVIAELNLYTGKIGYTFKHAPSIFIGNAIGTFLSAFIILSTKYGVEICIKATNLCIPKYGDLVSTLFLGILCGMCMFIAVGMWRATKNPLVVILPVMTFILSGFEHSIADMAYGFIAFEPGMIPVVLVAAIGNLIGARVLHFLFNVELKFQK